MNEVVEKETTKWKALLRGGMTLPTGLTNLKDLSLYDTQVTDVGLAALKDLELATLTIPSAATTDLGLKNYLASLKPPSQLYLSEWKITDAGLIHLKQLNNLKRLDLIGTKITDAGVADLQMALTNCEITH